MSVSAVGVTHLPARTRRELLTSASTNRPSRTQIRASGYTPKYPRDYPASPSALRPLPYYPNLKTAFRPVTACLIFTYLEIYQPSPRDESGRPLNTAVTLHLDQISEDLQISRRTLFTALCVLATRWRSDEERWAARRAGREFLKPEHTRNGRWKLYSITGAIGYVPSTIVERHRNSR